MANTPISSNLLLMEIAVAVSPTIIGHMAVGDANTSNPTSLIPFRAVATLFFNFLTKDGLSTNVSIAAFAEHATVTGNAFEKSVGRPRCTSKATASRYPAT